MGYAVARLVDVLRYMPESRGFGSRWDLWDFLFTFSGRSMALGSTQPLKEMSTRSIFSGEKRPVRRADKLATFICRFSRNSGSLKFFES